MVDLLIGGSPCQDLSIAKIGGLGLSGEKSSLFFEYVKTLKKIKPKYFLLENVGSMKKSDKDIITQFIGVEPITINSSLVSALERKRYYWTNIPSIEQPKDRLIMFSDVIESNVENRYFFTEKTYLSMKKILKRSKEKGLGFRSGIIKYPWNEKFKNLDANYHKGCDGKRSMVQEKDGRLRMATPTECEKLQTLPKNYTEGVSNTRRYMALGNGWTADVIAHILSYIPETHLQTVVSLFDGISCGQVALERAGKIYNQYYASEIDKYAIQITQKNYPHTMQIGDVTQIDWTSFLGRIELIKKVI